VAIRLGLSTEEGEILAFLVHRHLVMAHLAFRRDSSDPALVVRFACEVGSPEVLAMLTLLTAADVTAVGPGVWTEWKSDLLADLHARTLGVLDGDGPSLSAEHHRRGLESLLQEWEPDDPVVRIGRQLPSATLRDLPPQRILEELVQLARLPADGIFVATRWQPDTSTVAVTVGTRESVAPGVFHRVTGALTSQRLEILAAGIHTLDDGIVIDHFTVLDPDFTGAPPPDRFADIATAIRAGIKADRAPTFTPRLNPLAPRPSPAVGHPVRVAIDNASSDTSTIVEVFATDAPGLLYRIASTLFDAGLSVRSAKVGTYLDQVVDGFHVTDQTGGKIVDVERLERVRKALEVAVTSAPGR
jgi:[protein-PII] uridylyltransferase